MISTRALPLFLVALALSCALGAPVRAQPLTTQDLASRGPERVRSLDRVWIDASRQREIAVRIYAPAPRPGVLRPLVVFSHGLGGSQVGYAYFGQHLASHGFVVIHPNHPGSDSEVAAQGRLALMRAGLDPRNANDRPRDLSFVIDQVELLRAREPSLAQVDLGQIGVAGHSFGAYTALAVVGQTIQRGARVVSFEDTRVRCALAMSSQGAGVIGLTPQSWAGIRVSVHTMTGTEDTGFGTQDVAERREAFEGMPPREKYHLTIAGAEHSAFSDSPVAGRDPRHHRWILATSLAYFRAQLQGERAAQVWLELQRLEAETAGEVIQERR